jgi:hypothetical protein
MSSDRASLPVLLLSTAALAGGYLAGRWLRLRGRPALPPASPATGAPPVAVEGSYLELPAWAVT